MPITYDSIEPPHRLRLLQELRLPIDAVRWGRAWRGVRRKRTERPQLVVLVPGFGATHRSLSPLGAFLRRLGHDVSDWGLGRNTGNAPELLEALAGRITEQARKAGRPVSLVGWSLGGYLSRELARDHPEAVRKVVTLGSPVIGGPRLTVLARWYRSRGYDLDEVERLVAERYATPLEVPVTAIYSKRDGVVAWQACIDRWSPNTRHVEVTEGHFGMGFAPRVWSIVAEELESP
jgi:pimeloyl-ACP methyl ester carboxylesterase